MRLPRRQEHFGAADHEGQRAEPRALHEGAPFDGGHDVLPSPQLFENAAAAAGKFNARSAA